MERLPYELRERVLRLLQLGDLATCRRVSRGLHQLVDEYLQTIQHVDVFEFYPWTDKDEEMPHYIHTLIGKHLRSVSVSIESGNHSTLFSFLSKHTPELESANSKR